MAAENLTLRREATLTYLAKLCFSLFAFTSVILFARLLGAAALGQYFFGFALVMVGARVSAGIGIAVKKRTSETESSPNDLLWVGLLLYGVVSFVGVIVFALASPFLAPVIGGYVSVAALAGAFVTTGGFYVLKHAYEGLGHPSRGNWADAVRMGFVFGLQVAVILLGYGVPSLFAALAGGAGITAIGLYAVTPLAITPTRSPDTEVVLSFARWSIPSQVLEAFHKRLDVMVLTVFAGSAAAGVYEAAKRLTMPGVVLSLSVSEALVVKVSGLDSLGRSEDVQENAESALSYAGIAAIPLVFGTAAFGDALLVTVYGTEFADAGLVLALLALFQAIHVYRFPFRAVLDGSDLPRANVRVGGGVVALNLIGSVALVGPLGALGVVLATLGAELLRFGYYQRLSTDVFGRVFAPRAWSWQLIAAVGMYIGLVVAMWSPWFTPWRLGSMLQLVAIGLFLYVSLLITLDRTVQIHLRRVVSRK